MKNEQLGYWTGKKRPPFSKEWRKRIGESQKGIPRSEITKQKISNTLKGHIVTKETREKIRLVHKGKKEKYPNKNKGKKVFKVSGSKHWYWKGGKEAYWGRVANSVYREFNLNIICERCGSLFKIEIHHKDKNRKNNQITNLQALCKSCHAITHHQEMSGEKVKSK